MVIDKGITFSKNPLAENGTSKSKLRMSGIDPEEYSGLVFGTGLERGIPLLKYKIDDKGGQENRRSFLKTVLGGEKNEYISEMDQSFSSDLTGGVQEKCRCHDTS